MRIFPRCVNIWRQTRAFEENHAGGTVARVLLNWIRMKMRTSLGKKRVARNAARQSLHSDGISLPRVFLFLELFVDKDIPQRSTK